jgi:ADP-ribosylglycohydrolase
MRLAPIPITFCDDPVKAAKAAQDQSLTTHNGLEAKECSRLMTEIIISLIHRKEGQEPKDVLIQTCDKF